MCPNIELIIPINLLNSRPFLKLILNKNPIHILRELFWFLKEPRVLKSSKIVYRIRQTLICKIHNFKATYNVKHITKPQNTEIRDLQAPWRQPQAGDSPLAHHWVPSFRSVCLSRKLRRSNTHITSENTNRQTENPIHIPQGTRVL